jgi:fumarate hydratase class I
MADALFPLGEDTTPYRKISSDYVSVDSFKGQDVLTVEPEGLRLLAETAFADINHLLRPGHLKQLASILSDPEATDNDRFVAYDLLKNANIAAGKVENLALDPAFGN